MVRLGSLLTICALLPTMAAAQPDAFLEAARTLALAATQPETAQTAAVADAVKRLDAALVEWDRTMVLLEQPVERDTRIGSRQLQLQRHLELALAYRTRGRLQDAVREFDAALTLEPMRSDVQLLRALTLETLGSTAEAQAAFRTAWLEDPRNPVMAYYALRRGRLAEPELGRARDVIRDTQQRFLTSTAPPSTPPFVILDVVADMLTPAPVVGDSRTAAAFHLLASGRYRDAVTALAAALERTPVNPADSPLARFTQAQAEEADGRVSEARRDYAASLAGALSGRSTIHVAIGRLAQVEGDADAAIASLTHAAALNPNEPLVHQELANAYASQGRTDDAMTELVAALLIAPGNGPVHAAIGRIFLDVDRPADAIPAFARALELNPNGYEVRYALATAFSRLGRSADAARELATFERLREAAQERRRKTIQDEVEQADTLRRGQPASGAGR